MLSAVESILELELRCAKTETGKDAGIYPPFLVETFTSTKVVANAKTIWTSEQRRRLLVDKCRQFFTATQEVETHAGNIDYCYSELVECNFVLHQQQTTKTVARVAYEILARLPPRPQALPDFFHHLPHGYFGNPYESKPATATMSRSWDDLKVVSAFNKNIIRMALLIVIYPQTDFILSQFVNMTSEMLEVCTSMGSGCSSVRDQHRWFAIRAFLWTSWQRSMMIFFYRRLGGRLRDGWTYGDSNDWLRPTYPASKVSLQEMSDQLSAVAKSRYMCTWAFELLRGEPICVWMDFRLFHERYTELFGDRPGRCNTVSDDSCDGKHSDHCERYKGMKIEDQSVHDTKNPHQKCARLTWDESSYRAIRGARAVSITTRTWTGHLSYCEASASTCAISHVWSHGQGGRPEDGMNLCLHERYCRLAETLGCDSYWMDTPCIPCDHVLRREAISQINTVFRKCAATIICDKDLMEIEAVKLTTRLRESILTATLVSDWNARAWTFLEAVKGRRTIHILCKNDTLISFRELIQDVYTHGRIDVAILCLLTPHLLPWRGEDFPRSKFNREILLAGEMPIEIAGTLLSYRPASRLGDEIVIWSLIFDGERAFYTAEDFWRSRIGSGITTGYLLSSSKRLDVEGLSWAPMTPYAAPSADEKLYGRNFYRAFDGMETKLGRIYEHGLFAPWMVSEFDATRRNIYFEVLRWTLKRSTTQARIWRELGKIRSQFLGKYWFGALLQARSQSGASHLPEQDVAKYPGKIGGTLVAVCGSNDTEPTTWKFRKNLIPGEPNVIKSVTDARPIMTFKWIWMGVYEWPKEIPLPVFTREPFFWIA